MKKHNINTLPKWAQKHIKELESKVTQAEQTIPWTKPGMRWFTILHPDTRTDKDKEEWRKLFFLDKDSAQAVCVVGPNDCVFLGRGKQE